MLVTASARRVEQGNLQQRLCVLAAEIIYARKHRNAVNDSDKLDYVWMDADGPSVLVEPSVLSAPRKMELYPRKEGEIND